MGEVIAVAVACTVFLSIFAIFGNTAIIVLFFKVRSLQTVSNTLVTAIAFVDLFGVTLYPMQCLVDLKMLNDNPECMIFMSLITITSVAHSFIMLSLSIERFVMISKPMLYSTIVTEKRCYTALALIVTYAVVTGVLPASTFRVNSSLQDDCRLVTAFGSKWYVMWVFVNWTFPLPVVIVIYAKLFFVVRRHVRSIAATEVILQHTCASNSSFKLRREAKTALLLFSMVVYFIAAWIPLIVVILATDPAGSPWLYITAHFSIYSNSAVSPFIYGFGNKLYRQHFLSMLGLQRLVRNDDRIPAVCSN